MAKEEPMEVRGIVVDALPNATFRVKLENGHVILATIAGKLRLKYIRILVGDKVVLRMSVYDLNRGIIVWRDK